MIDQRFERRSWELFRPFFFNEGVFSVRYGAAIGVGMLLLEGFDLGVALLRLFRVVSGLAIILIDERRVVVHHDDAIVAGNGAQHIIGHVARMVGELARGGVGSNYRRLADKQRLVKRGVGDVGN